uniref:hypothetical protein n=1 Tax=Gonatophragmium mori TaxID=2966219 RepID=UPI0023D83448|nr:hypothetical protein P2Z26_mgp02 [Gonatophragmium mori]WCZ71135.1 hypothetical protein [Gonatophragmium mori]
MINMTNIVVNLRDLFLNLNINNFLIFISIVFVFLVIFILFKIFFLKDLICISATLITMWLLFIIEKYTLSLYNIELSSLLFVNLFDITSIIITSIIFSINFNIMCIVGTTLRNYIENRSFKGNVDKIKCALKKNFYKIILYLILYMSLNYMIKTTNIGEPILIFFDLFSYGLFGISLNSGIDVNKILSFKLKDIIDLFKQLSYNHQTIGGENLPNDTISINNDKYSNIFNMDNKGKRPVGQSENDNSYKPNKKSKTSGNKSSIDMGNNNRGEGSKDVQGNEGNKNRSIVRNTNIQPGSSTQSSQAVPSSLPNQSLNNTQPGSKNLSQPVMLTNEFERQKVMGFPDQWFKVIRSVSPSQMSNNPPLDQSSSSGYTYRPPFIPNNPAQPQSSDTVAQFRHPFIPNNPALPQSSDTVAQFRSSFIPNNPALPQSSDTVAQFRPTYRPNNLPPYQGTNAVAPSQGTNAVAPYMPNNLPSSQETNVVSSFMPPYAPNILPSFQETNVVASFMPPYTPDILPSFQDTNLAPPYMPSMLPSYLGTNMAPPHVPDNDITVYPGTSFVPPHVPDNDITVYKETNFVPQHVPNNDITDYNTGSFIQAGVSTEPSQVVNSVFEKNRIFLEGPEGKDLKSGSSIRYLSYGLGFIEYKGDLKINAVKKGLTLFKVPFNPIFFDKLCAQQAEFNLMVKKIGHSIIYSGLVEEQGLYKTRIMQGFDPNHKSFTYYGGLFEIERNYVIECDVNNWNDYLDSYNPGFDNKPHLVQVDYVAMLPGLPCNHTLDNIVEGRFTYNYLIELKNDIPNFLSIDRCIALERCVKAWHNDFNNISLGGISDDERLIITNEFYNISKALNNHIEVLKSSFATYDTSSF